ncbi:hypothetical protein CCR75_005904 [Bremia lactucae]|uniref:Uncharacterized protein n=1 Tax=Bremia lactucae TaxID=4779 RepID=A0A976FEB6_BRELC|nr:hypothetical protein CCR75_005904 [Bremia lactucae]
MATRIADRSLSFSSGENASELSKLEITRLALAQEQKKRIDAAVARVTGKKESGKRKGLATSDEIFRSKKSKTVIDVGSDRAEKKNSIARRMVDRFSAMPEPELEAEVEQPIQVTTRSVSTQQFVARSMPIADLSAHAQREESPKVEERPMLKKLDIDDAEESKTEAKAANLAAEDEEEEDEEEEEKSVWDGPTTNYHVKQLGLDDNVDIYAPVVQQQYDVQRVRERAMYMPNSVESVNAVKASADSETDSAVALNKPLHQESEERDADLRAEVDANVIQALLEEPEEFVKDPFIAIDTAWTKRVFTYLPLFIVSIIVLVSALLFVIDRSQETFRFCEFDAENSEGSGEILMCASFLHFQSLSKSILREIAMSMQKTVQFFFK